MLARQRRRGGEEGEEEVRDKREAEDDCGVGGGKVYVGELSARR